MEKSSLDIIEDAIADVGYWRWWYVKNDTAVVEFGGVQLFDNSAHIDTVHSSILSLQFSEGSSLQVFSRENEYLPSDWHIRLQKDEIDPFTVTNESLKFGQADAIRGIESSHPHRISLKDGVSPSESAFVLSFEAGPVAVLVTGNKLRVINADGEVGDANVGELSRKWWEYWKAYWRAKDTDAEMTRDYACEVTIPIG